MSKNVIFAGPILAGVEPITHEKPVVGTPLPGTIVHSDSSNGTVHFTTANTTQMGSLLSVMSNRRELGQDVTTAWTAGDLGVAYIPRPGEIYNVRVAAATYAANAPLTLSGTSGRLTSTLATGDLTLATFADTPGAYSAGDLAAVRFIAGKTK